MPGVHGAALATKAGHGFTTNSGDDSLLAYDAATNRIFAGCSKTSVVVDAATGKVVASIPNGTRVDALGWDPSRKLIYIPNGGDGTVTVVRDPQRVSVPAAARPCSGACRRCTAARTGWRAWTRSPGPIVAAWFVAIKS